MTLFQDTAGDPRAARASLADVLAWYGAVGDAAAGNPPGFALRKASVAVSLAQIANADDAERHALFFAGLLHAIGAIGNAACRKGEDISPRAARSERWDIPAQGSRVCAQIAALPAACADLVRWQAERWDGTGFPDQLRWHGIPPLAQYLALADAYVRASDPDEALGEMSLQSGRGFGPTHARTFTMWFHSTGGEFELHEVPLDALDAAPEAAAWLLDRAADAIDAHNGVSGRWRRIDALAQTTARALGLDAAATRALALATRIFGAGELHAAHAEGEEFDPLARLGIDERARNATAAADLARPHAALRDAAEIVAARAEWFDGTGKPRGIGHADLATASGVLAAAIAHASLDRAERLETAIGTQFDPRVVPALLEAAKARA
ncbi:MAG: hypothetical protein KGN02_12320 [bacterium]|nr:hypothetical protein [bacterium]